MRRRLLIGLGCALIPIAIVVPWVAHAAGGDIGFDNVISSIEQRYHVQATNVPFTSLASLIADGATLKGVNRIHIAEFEHFAGPVDGEELNRMVEEKLGQGWSRIVRSTSRHYREQTLVFARSEGNRTGLFILDLDGKEMDVVEVSVDPSQLKDTIAKYERQGSDEDDDSQPSN